VGYPTPLLTLTYTFLADVIQCTECQYEKTTDSFYQHLSVEVPDHLEGKPSSENITHALGSLLADSLKAEVLDENNKWECSSCNRKVCANRLHQYKSLPETVTIQLKRFRFDPVSSVSCYTLFLWIDWTIFVDKQKAS
jgi:ubiquitin C-terminal hydrolase